MEKTENLQLNIIEGTDVPSHAVFNENFNKLDKFANETNDNSVSLNNRMETLETDVETKIINFENEVTEKVTNLEKIFDDTVLVIQEKLSDVEIEVGGEIKKGKMKRLVLKVTPSYSSFYETVPLIDTSNNVIYPVSEKRCLISHASGFGSVNLTELIGLQNVEDILLLNTQLYSDEFVSATSGNGNTIPMDCFSLQKLTYPGASDDIYLTYRGDMTTFTKQEYRGVNSGGWQPSITPATPVSRVYIVISYVDFDN